MQVIDRGGGLPLIVVPGVQGRWEYMGPALDALAECFRVITFPLGGERRSGYEPDPSRGLDGLADQIEAVLENRQLRRALICGISFGGLIALRFAARSPALASALVLVSTPGPSWRLRDRHRLYARAPGLFGPVFLAEAPWRLRTEVICALPGRRARRRFVWQQARALATSPISPSRMAARSRLIDPTQTRRDCAHISVPTLVVAGEPALDRVVAGTSAEYANLIQGARLAVLERTGHLGYVTRPVAFAQAVAAFTRGLPVDFALPASNTMASPSSETPGPARLLESIRR
jgi:pimeloyl-ACP methyl ester carboxylesterase